MPQSNSIARPWGAIFRVLFVCLITCAAGCAARPAPLATRAVNTGILYQTDPLSRLLEGGYSGGRTTLGELVKLGDFGVGTFSGYRGGEMWMLAGRVFSIPNPTTSVQVQDLATKIPFAMVTQFQPTQRLKIDALEDFEALQSLLNRYLDPKKNYAILIDGKFQDLDVQCVQPPGKPGLPFAEIAQTKAKLTDASAKLVGFKMSTEAEAVNHPGFHFHARTTSGQGGHVLEFRHLGPAVVSWQEASELRVLHDAK